MKSVFVRCSLVLAVSLLLACGGRDNRGGNDIVGVVPPGNTPNVSDSPPPESNPPEVEPPPAPETPLSLPEQLDAYFSERQSLTAAGVSVLVMKDGEIVYQGSKGMANINAGISLNEHTGFRLASVSKSFTALAIMQLVEAGEIDIHDSILDYLPELPNAWRAITVEMLISHKSGIYDLLNDNWNPALLEGLTNAGARAHFAINSALEFTPGSRMDYSNSGYVLLAEIIERVTAYDFADYMREFIFEPVGMEHSYITDENQPLLVDDALNRATSHTFYGVTTYISGNMAQVSSASDFVHFFTALRAGELVSSETIETMVLQRGTLFGGGYGYGFMLNGNSYGHQGSWDGFRTIMTIDPELNLEFVVLTNGGSATQSYIFGVRNIVYSFYQE